MKHKHTILLWAACTAFTACSSYDFEQEQYRKEINLLQNSEGIYDRQVVNLNDQDTEKGAIINLVAGLSGSTASTQNYRVTLIPSDSLFKAYNKSNFDIETDRYAKLLPEECYEAPELTKDIPAGESKVLFPFRLKNMERLSPDSIYMLNYEIDPASTTPVNAKKRHVLLRIHWENEFASTATQMNYSYNSTMIITPGQTATQVAEVRRPTGTVRAFPLTKNSVRMMAGEESWHSYPKAAADIKQKSIIIEVGKQLPENPLAREVTIKPYNAEEIEVRMMTPLGDYDNTFLLNELAALGGGNSTHYKEFRLHYKYRLLRVKQSDGTYKPGPLREVQAKLRYQYNPRANEL